ncbi:hypothetical protein [Rugamonas sp. DEMB1]|uniref:hypothetical protein n=1 Tax=Rugamonas sp. DEMB1 TaxID=3039386 RepID=UPI00244B4640|nr:hypothetical protein [Rugamonas sp. DEMB1]WGG52366.1 hypothetical protein QC826_09575 [Rugamonas sp. DEMB1]
MSELQREELDAKLAMAEARTDARMAETDIKIVQGYVKMASIEGKIDALASLLNEKISAMAITIAEVKAGINNLRTTVVVTAISIGLASVFGVAAFNATVLSNMLASFESGKNMSAAQAEVQRQLEATAVLLNKVQKQIDQAPAPAPKK